MPDTWTLTTEIIACEEERNAKKASIHWNFTIDDARIDFKEHDPTLKAVRFKVETKVVSSFLKRANAIENRSIYKQTLHGVLWFMVVNTEE